MFKINKYHHYYYSIINRAQSRILPPNTYVERHHIIPSSLGGENVATNIVNLTGKEHALCHLLLVKMTEGDNKSKMACAAWRMMFSSNTHQRHKLSIRSYEMVRTEMAKAASIRSSNYRHSDERKKKIAESKIGKPRNITPEWRAKIIAAQTGIKKVACSPERKAKISKALTGVKTKPMSAESKAKLSASKKGKKLFIDPVTGQRSLRLPGA